MALEKLINETDTVVALPAIEQNGEVFAITPSALVPLTDLTSAAINHYAVVTSPDHANAGAGGNISCAIVTDGFALRQTDSEEDDERTLCDPGNSVDLTDYNFDAEMQGFRDKNPDDTTSQFNLWRNLTFAPDVPYILVHRVGYKSDVAFASGQVIDAYYVLTDLPVNVHADGAKQKISQTFVSKSEAVFNHTLSA